MKIVNFFKILFFLFLLVTSNFSYADTLTFGSSTYTGDIKKDKAHGTGVFTFSDGSKYEGKFSKNRFHGKGKYTDKDGNVYEGKWRNNKFTQKINKKTREVITLSVLIDKSKSFEVRGIGKAFNKWFEAEKNSEGIYVLTSKGKKDMEKAIKAGEKTEKSSAC